MTAGPQQRTRPEDPLVQQQRLSNVDRLQPLLLIGAIGLGLALARIAPVVAASLLPLVTVGVGFLIYLIMLGLDLSRLRSATRQGRFVATAVVVNFLVVPFMAWALGAMMLSDHPELRVGLLLFLITPCIGWYLVFIDLAGGDTALGATLLGINLALQVILLPVYLQLFAAESVAADLSVVVRSVLVYLLVPAALAYMTRAVLSRRDRRAAAPNRWTGAAVSRRPVLQGPPIAVAKTTTLFVVIASMFASQVDTLTDDPATLLRVVPPIVTFFVLVFVLAVAIARLQRMPFDHLAVLVFTTASRNSEASLAIAVTAFSSPLVAAVVAVGPAIELPLLVLMVRALAAIGNSWPGTVRRLPA